MRLKALPEDFVVEEKIQLPLDPGGKHVTFRIRKREVTTLQVQEDLARLLRTGKEQVAFPALKDKDAIATQYVSVAMNAPANVPAPLPSAGYSLELVGTSARALQPSDLRGNAFTIVVRDLALDEAQKVGPRLRQIAEYGLPNYFDEQRFGSYSGESGFIGKMILRRDSEGALRTYLSYKMAGDPERVRVFKEYAAEHWGEWAALMEHAPKPSNYRSVLTYLKDHQDELAEAGAETIRRKALNLIPHRLLTLYLSAYQSWLWNLIAARTVAAAVAEHHFAAPTVRVAGQELPVYFNLPESARVHFDRVSIALPNHRAVYGDAELAQSVAKVLAAEGLTLNDFKARILKKAFAAKSSRPLAVHPSDVQVGDAENDELARKRWKVTVRFTLPPGSYATLTIKALFARGQG